MPVAFQNSEISALRVEHIPQENRPVLSSGSSVVATMRESTGHELSFVA